jgi:arsenate reductase-like glutaredoxin family protein
MKAFEEEIQLLEKEKMDLQRLLSLLNEKEKELKLLFEEKKRENQQEGLFQGSSLDEISMVRTTVKLRNNYIFKCFLFSKQERTENEIESLLSYSPLTENRFIREKLSEFQEEQDKQQQQQEHEKSFHELLQQSSFLSSSRHLSPSSQDVPVSIKLANQSISLAENSVLLVEEDPSLLKQIENIRNRVLNELVSFHPSEKNND